MKRLRRGGPLLALFLAASAGAAAPASLSGSKVKSNEWRVHRDKGQDEYVGDVSYEREDGRFLADWALWDRRSELFRARGNVYGLRLPPEGGTLEAWAAEGGCRFQERAGWAESGAEPVRFRRGGPDGSRLEGAARRASWKGPPAEQPRLEPGSAAPAGLLRPRPEAAAPGAPAGLLRLEGGVSLRGSSETARGEWAVHSLGSGELRLGGGPPVLTFEGDGFRGVLQADGVRLLPDQGALDAAGSVRGWVRFPPSSTPAAGAAPPAPQVPRAEPAAGDGR